MPNGSPYQASLAGDIPEREDDDAADHEHEAAIEDPSAWQPRLCPYCLHRLSVCDGLLFGGRFGLTYCSPACRALHGSAPRMSQEIRHRVRAATRAARRALDEIEHSPDLSLDCEAELRELFS